MCQCLLPSSSTFSWCRRSLMMLIYGCSTQMDTGLSGKGNVTPSLVGQHLCWWIYGCLWTISSLAAALNKRTILRDGMANIMELREYCTASVWMLTSATLTYRTSLIFHYMFSNILATLPQCVSRLTFQDLCSTAYRNCILPSRMMLKYTVCSTIDKLQPLNAAKKPSDAKNKVYLVLILTTVQYRHGHYWYR